MVAVMLGRYFKIVGATTVAAIVIRLIWGIPTWVVLAILLIGWPLAGTLITIDDDLPGGWSNPDGKSKPEWKMLWWWSDILLVRGAFVLLSFVIEEAIAARFSAGVLVVSLAMAALGVPMFVRGFCSENRSLLHGDKTSHGR